MNNYVLLYHFDEEEREKQFRNKVKETYSRHREEQSGAHTYIGFAAGEEPGVVDKLNTLLSELGLSSEYFGPNNYIALYFSRDKDPDNIKRQLLIGTAEMVDKDAEKTASDAHMSHIQRLLQHDFLKV